MKYNNKRKCPICEQLFDTTEHSSPHGTEEEYGGCNYGHYYYEFSYGVTRVTVGDEEFCFSYHHDENDMKVIQEIIVAVRNYIKTHKTEIVEILL